MRSPAEPVAPNCSRADDTADTACARGSGSNAETSSSQHPGPMLPAGNNKWSAQRGQRKPSN